LFCAATHPPAVYRGNPFLIEVGLAYGGASSTRKVTLDALTDLLSESDARSLKQFLLTTFDGVGATGADKILSQARM
jgi:DNA topoisomerase VI subunit B